MPTIQIKRSQVTATPSSLVPGELAYSEASDTLFIGVAGPAVSAIAGSGVFAKLASPTFTGTPSAPTAANSDNSTQLATTAFVKAQSYLTGNQTIIISGDASGTGTENITLTLPNIVSADTKAKITYNAKGQVTAGADLTASDIPSLLAAKISDFDTQVRLNRLDQFAVPTDNVSLNSQRITALASPISATDAANKSYVDNVIQGLDTKESVKAATTANIALTGLLTIDSVSLSAGDRVLVKNQSTGSQNGIYLASSSTWIRSEDFNSSGKVTPGAFFFVEQGATYADTGWVLTNDSAITLDTTVLTFTQFSGAGSVAAGDGLSKSGITLTVVGTTNRIIVSGSGVDIASNYVGQSSISTLGTITTGIWSGTPIDATKGGTGQTGFATGDIMYANSTSSLTRLAKGANGSVLTVASNLPAWSDTVDGGSF